MSDLTETPATAHWRARGANMKRMAAFLLLLIALSACGTEQATKLRPGGAGGGQRRAAQLARQLEGQQARLERQRRQARLGVRLERQRQARLARAREARRLARTAAKATAREAAAAEAEAEEQALVAAAPASSNCDYDPCLPPASDYDCEGGGGDGPAYTGYVRVIGSDPYGLDADGDGVGCED